MNPRYLIWVGLIIGSTIGGWIPSLWDSGMLSFSGIMGSMIGGLFGIYFGYKIANW